MRTVTELMSLQDRGAIVIGGSGHIGRSICGGLMEMGADVVVIDRDESGNATYIQADIEDAQAAREATREAIGRLGRLDILVHCAAFVGTTQIPGWNEPFIDQSENAWNRAMAVNVTSAFAACHEASTALHESGSGAIILVSSIYGLLGPDFSLYAGTGMNNPAAYGVSKAGLIQLTKYLACVLAPTVRSNSISPGGVFRNQPQSFVDRYVARTPLQRMASEEDIKGAAVYLASDLSRYVTGHNLIVDGGWSAW